MTKHPIHARFRTFGDLLRELDRRRAGADEQAAAIRLWCRDDLAAFCLTAFPARFPDPFNRLHLDWFKRRKEPYHQRSRREQYAVAAPRGAAKSTVVSFADVLHDIVYGLEAFVGIVSYNHRLSDQLVGDLYHVLRTPDAAPELHAIFGPFEVSGTKTEFVAFSRRYGRARGTAVRAYSARSTMRGQKHDGVRFTKILLDDLEDPDRVRQPANRDLDQRFVESDAIQAGEPGLTTIMVGTVLCADSVLQRYLDPRAGSWESRHYRSLMAWPNERHGLWEQARGIWSDLSLGGARARYDAMIAFYEQNRAAMDAGAEVLWHARRPLPALMTTYWEKPRAFFAEDQNEPQESTEITFDVDRFQYVSFDGERIIRDDGTSVPLASCRVRGWWDPIPMRERGTGRDEAGWAVVARCPNGGRYVLHASAARMTPAEQWDQTASLMSAFPTSRWGYENNTGGLDENEDWRAFLRRRGLTGRITGHQTAKSRKEDRIAEIQPGCHNGFIRFSRTDVSPATYAQFRQFPFGRNDDIIDAIERACYLASGDEESTMRVTGIPR